MHSLLKYVSEQCLEAFADIDNWLSLFSAESRDDFYLAPEYQEHGIVTEKVRPAFIYL